MEFLKFIYEKPATKFIILFVVLINLVIFNHHIARYISIEQKDLQYIYYFFSTSAQSIATFIAFLIAGYALVYQAMDNLENRDDSLIEIHHKIKMDYYSSIQKLTGITGLAIIFSLFMIWLNGYQSQLKNELLLITVLLILLAIIMGIRFVIYIIDPEKIRKAALKLFKEDFEPGGPPVDESNFISIFIDLERTLRNFVKINQIVVNYHYPRKDFVSFRDIIEGLIRNEIISKTLFKNLLEINKYRNLVIHGELTQVNEQMVFKVKEILNEIRKIIDAYNESA